MGFIRNMESFVAMNLQRAVEGLEEWNPAELGLRQAGTVSQAAQDSRSSTNYTFFHGLELFPSA